MNSISYLDSVLTRSLTSSRTASGSATPANDAAESSRLNRRASDYSLSKQRDRERRRIAASLGFSTIDSHDEPVRKPKSSSKKGSRSGSTKGSDLEGSNERSRSNHTKASSEGRARLKRTGSTPAPMRNSLSSSKWGGLWGLGSWLDSTESDDWKTQRREASSGKQRLLFPQDADTRGGAAQRRASTSDAEAALANIAPDALLSERERENVVDFEGYDPEEDLLPGIGANAPPSTPFTTGDTTPTRDTHKRTQRSRSNTGASTGSRLSAILFGALNPLTDDYFGPQPSETPVPPQNRRKKSDDGTERKRFKDDKRKVGKNELSEKNVMLLQSAEKDGESSSKESQSGLPSEPPPPYSDVASSVTSGSVLLPSPSLEALHGASKRSSTRRRLATLVIQGFKGAIIFLRRVMVAIVLSPVRAVRYLFRTKDGTHEVIVEVQNGLERKRSGKKFQTSSQAERPTAARHSVGRRIATTSDEGSSSDELVTEEQAEARALRKAARKKAISEEEAAVEKSTALLKAEATSMSNRLLPNPNPIDPLLAHDRAAKAKIPDSSSALTLSPGSVKGFASGVATINRGPLSSLIHHSPKVLVLDLDETLIHSTSRSPTWGALTDKSKGRAAVTTGGGLLGLEGLGGIMGLQGQVGVRPHQVEVVLDGRSIIYHVYKRPHVDHFLRKVAAWYHVVIFTASVQEYADPVIDWLDQGRGLVGTRLFRESCTYRNGSYLKNLAHVDADLSRICLVDNSPASYLINQANGIPIEGWTHDPNDEGLLDLLPVLDSLRFASDVRHILGLRGFIDSKINGNNTPRRV